MSSESKVLNVVVVHILHISDEIITGHDFKLELI